jgi:hypothetical protein
VSCILYLLSGSTFPFTSIEGCGSIVERYVDTVSRQGKLSQAVLRFW